MKKLLDFCKLVKNSKKDGLSAYLNEFNDLMNSGYRKYGLLHDDLAPINDPLVAEAVSRLHPDIVQERVFRCRRAEHLNIHNEYLPKHLQTKPSEDIRYLEPLIEQVEAERDTKQIFSSLQSVPEVLKKRNRILR